MGPRQLTPPQRDEARQQQRRPIAARGETRQSGIGERRIAGGEPHRRDLHRPAVPLPGGERAAQRIDVAVAHEVAAARGQRRRELRGRGGVVGDGRDREQRVEYAADVAGIEEPPRRDELESRAVVAMDETFPDPTRQEALDAGFPESQMTEVFVGGSDAEVFTRRSPQRRRGLQYLIEPSAVVGNGMGRAHDHQIPGRAVPHLHMGENGAHAADDRGDDRQRQLIELYPLAEHAVIGESRSRDPEELGRVQRGDAGDPGIAGFGDDEVVARGVDLQRAARIVHDRRYGGAREHVPVHRGKMRRHAQYGGLQLDDANSGHPRDIGESAGRDPAAESDDQSRLRVGVRDRRREPDENLGVHVPVIGRVGLAVHLQGATGGTFPNGRRGVPPFPEIQLARAGVVQEAAAVCRRHPPARVDRGAEVDQPGTPLRRGEGDDERGHRKGTATQHSDSQSSMLGGPFWDTLGGGRHQSDRRGSIDDDAQTQRDVRPEPHDQHEPGQGGADDAAEGVERVGAADVRAPGFAFRRHDVRQQREGHAHPDGGNQDDGADRQTHEGEATTGVETGDLEDVDDVQGQPAEE